MHKLIKALDIMACKRGLEKGSLEHKRFVQLGLRAGLKGKGVHNASADKPAGNG